MTDYMDTLLGEIPILTEPQPQKVSIYEENSEANDWLNKTLTTTLVYLGDLSAYTDITPGYFLIKNLVANLTVGATAHIDVRFIVGILDGDVIFDETTEIVSGLNKTYDLNDIFKDVKLQPGVTIYMSTEVTRNYIAGHYDDVISSLYISGFKIRPFNPYEPPKEIIRKN